MLDNAGSGLGEPLNVRVYFTFDSFISRVALIKVIISGQSSPEVLTDDGFLNWARSVSMYVIPVLTATLELLIQRLPIRSTECFGLHLGGPQSANLGDGNGWVNQTVEMRYDFGNADLGTCLESLSGGNHFRMFRQNGTQANSGALFLACVSFHLPSILFVMFVRVIVCRTRKMSQKAIQSSLMAMT